MQDDAFSFPLDVTGKIGINEGHISPAGWKRDATIAAEEKLAVHRC